MAKKPNKNAAGQLIAKVGMIVQIAGISYKITEFKHDGAYGTPTNIKGRGRWLSLDKAVPPLKAPPLPAAPLVPDYLKQLGCP